MEVDGLTNYCLVVLRWVRFLGCEHLSLVAVAFGVGWAVTVDFWITVIWSNSGSSLLMIESFWCLNWLFCGDCCFWFGSVKKKFSFFSHLLCPFQLFVVILWYSLVASASVFWSLRALCMFLVGQASCPPHLFWTVPLFCRVHLLQSNLCLVHLLVLLLPWFISVGCQVLFLTLTLCNNFETALNFAWSALKLVLLDSHKTYHI